MQRYPIIPFHHLRTASSPRLLRDLQGEILIISIKGKKEVCFQPHDYHLQMAVVRFVAACSSNARFFVGVVTPKGGRFYVISRDEAVKRMDRWIVESFE